MSHHLAHRGYRQLTRRLNKFPQGAPPSETLYRILSLLMSEGEAQLLSQLPLRPFSAAKAARIWKVPEHQAQHTLERLATRALLLDLEREDGGTIYFLPPPMAGFFEFSLMRMRPDLDQKELAGQLYQYLNVEEDFLRELYAGATSIGRVFVHEPAIPEEEISQVLDYERASEAILTASDTAVSLCFCRHKMLHAGRACGAPLDNCLTLNEVARSLVRHGNARRIEAAEGLDILKRARELRLVQCADNVRKGVNFICNCCGCCCEALIAARRLALPHAMYSTNFVPRIDEERCNGCGRCAAVCPTEVISVTEVQGKDGRTVKRAVVDEELCMGCGVCVGSCGVKAILLAARPKRVLAPVNTAHRLVLMAIERGKLQNLIFDNQAYLSHRALAAVFGAIFKLPPVKRLLASRQLKSRYLERLLEDVGPRSL